MVNVQMLGVEKVQKMLFILPEKLTKEVDKASGEFMAFVQKSAKLRAPRFSGQLAQSISKKQINKGWELSVDSPYGFFQEYGWSPVFLFANIYSRAGYRIGDWMEAHGIDGFGIKPSGIAHPFIGPALAQGLVKLPVILENAAYKAAKESIK